MDNKIDESFILTWMSGFADGLEKLSSESRACLLSCCAKRCADTGVLDMQKRLYADCGNDLDMFYSRLCELGGVSAETVEPGRRYIVRYPGCACDLHTSCGVDTPCLCECSRQSILYCACQVTGREDISAKCLESVLFGGNECRFEVAYG